MLKADQEQLWFEHKKICLARYIFPRVNQLTRKGISWRDWWREMYGESYDDYVETMKQAKAGS